MNKVFFIGFNKCATKSFHYLFLNNGYHSVHYDMGRPSRINLAQKMSENMQKFYPILKDIDKPQVFSDMVYHREDDYIEGIDHFRQLHVEYPDAYFVLQTRPLEGWLESRFKNKKGQYADRCRKALQLNTRELAEKWTQDYLEHHDAVRDHFANRGKFLEYDITSDTIDKLIDFVSPEYSLDPKHWGHVGKSV